MLKQRIGVFGCGNMGRALVLGIKARFPDVEFFLFTPGQTRARELAALVDGKFIAGLKEMPNDLDWYILAFKPQNLDEFQFSFQSHVKILSVLAGVKSDKFISKFGVKKVARLMPNTPSSIGLGANLLFFSESVDGEEKEQLSSLLASTGTIFPLQSEKDLDLATAFSGSGPALIFELARIFEEELIRMTEGRLPAKEIVARTFYGSASLMSAEKNADISFLELRDQVTSKKGVTFEALEVLRKSNLQSLFSRAFEAAYKRTLELSK